jgi:uncharacterized protein
VRVHGDDYERLGAGAEALSHWLGNEVYMRMIDGHCAALRLEGHAFVCSVYGNRPEICRSLERGSPACVSERFDKVGVRSLPQV